MISAPVVLSLALVLLATGAVIAAPVRQSPKIVASAPEFAIPPVAGSKLAKLPSEVDLERSNNCVGAILFEGRLFVGWRSGTHIPLA